MQSERGNNCPKEGATAEGSTTLQGLGTILRHTDGGDIKMDRGLVAITFESCVPNRPELRSKLLQVRLPLVTRTQTELGIVVTFRIFHLNFTNLN
jgi:hypothetical protein